MNIQLPDHPLTDLATFITQLPNDLDDIPSKPELLKLLTLQADAPLQSSDEVRLKVRDLLRHGGFKPTGRSKPASEYLIKAATNEKLEAINLAVDVCNVVSLHSGLPISVIDLDLASEPLSIQIAEPGTSYVFNASGQLIDVGKLLCLFDAEGACANAVKDSQRTKTHPQTRRTLTVIWGTNELAGRTAAAAAWYRQLLQDHEATTEDVM